MWHSEQSVAEAFPWVKWEKKKAMKFCDIRYDLNYVKNKNLQVYEI